MNFKVILFVTIVLLTMFAHQAIALNNSAKITCKVIDEEGMPVEGAQVEVGFIVDYGNDFNKRMLTNSNGVAEVYGQSTIDRVGYRVAKTGYYKSIGEYYFEGLKSGKWKPWNPEIIIVLRKIINPVPMYARNTKFATDVKKEIPVLNEYIGFDLIKFDWVIPYGNGAISDFIFKIEKKFNSKNDFNASLYMKFTNEYDGILIHKENTRFGSEYSLPRYAPVTQYMDALLFSINRKEASIVRNVEYQQQDTNYFFRIRSEEKNGKLSKAIYGKILGPIVFDPVFSETAFISFKYYLNPDFTRNLEFDPERNLFGELPPLERVGIK